MGVRADLAPERSERRRPRPKELEVDPDLYVPSADGGFRSATSGDELVDPRTGVAVKGPTDERGTGSDPDGHGGGALDAEIVEMARDISSRLRLPLPRRATDRGRPRGRLETHPYADVGAELDLDRTLESILGQPLPTEDHMHVRERSPARQSVVLLVDVSGSMKGEKARTMAATVAALAAHLRSDELAILAFWSAAAWISRFNDPVTARSTLESLLALPAQGLTNVSFPLEEAGRVVSRASPGTTRVLLLSDCVHNAGPDPRRAAARIGRRARLDVLLDTVDESDPELASDLARMGNGRMRPVSGHRDVAASLAAIFAS